MEIIKDLKEVLKTMEILKETDIIYDQEDFKRTQFILNKWIKVFENFYKGDSRKITTQGSEINEKM